MNEENILAVLIGEPQTWANNTRDTGQRALLSVVSGQANTQSYTFIGNSLYQIHYDVGVLSSEEAFTFFCRQFYNKPATWFQLAVPPPNPLLFSSGINLIPQSPPPNPIGSGTMILIDSGYDPLKGFYLTFDGNFDLTCPIFKGFSGMIRNTPNYQIRIS